MSKTDTPETDAVLAATSRDPEYRKDHVPVNFARTLERQRNDARRIALGYQRDLKTARNHIAETRRLRKALSGLRGYDVLKLVASGGDRGKAWLTGCWDIDGDTLRFRLLVPSPDGDGGHRLDITVTPDNLFAEIYEPNGGADAGVGDRSEA